MSTPDPDPGSSGSGQNPPGPGSSDNGQDPPVLDPNQALLEVTRLLTRLSTQVSVQTLPEPIVFSQGSGRSLSDFFSEFETYAQSTYGPDRRYWTPRLGKYLKDKVLDLYNSLSQINQDYAFVKKALLSAFEAQTTNTTAELLDKFAKCRYDEGEGISGFVSRLSALATTAYAGATQTTIDEIVKQRCISSLPEYLRTTLNFWLLANPNASLQELIRVGSGLERSLPSVPEASAIAVAPHSSQELASSGARPKAPVTEQQPDLNQARPVSARAGNPRTPSRFCKYCRKKGHSIENCYMKCGRCFRCGQSGHFVSECPSSVSGPRMARPRLPHSAMAPSYIPSTTPNFESGIRPQMGPVSPTCMFCGSPEHMMGSCPQFATYIEAVVAKQLNC